MPDVALGRGLVRLDEGRAFTWEPGPPLSVRHDGPVAALPVLGAAAAAVRAGTLAPDPARPVEHLVQTPYGEVRIEAHGAPGAPTLVLYETRAAATLRDRLMVQLVSMTVGIPAARIAAANAPVQVLDLGRPTLVVPVGSPDALAALKEGPTDRLAPGIEAVCAYVVTQRRPYVKMTTRVVPQALQTEPLVVAAAAVHALNTAVLRADYPITRIVCSPPGAESRIECRCHLVQGQGGPRWVRLRVGAEVAP